MALLARPYVLAQLRPASVISYEAQAGRTASTAAALLAGQRLGAVVVLAVGTDGRQTPTSFAALLQIAARVLGSERCLVLSTVFDAHRNRGALNDEIERFAAAHPHTVRVSSWEATVLARHVRLRDGAYPANSSGWQLYAELLARAARTCEQASASKSRPPVPALWPGNAGPVRLPVSATPPPSASAAAIKWWTSGGSALYTTGWHNGQCTELAWERRPDIVARVAEDFYDRSASGTTVVPVNWDATFWDADAAAAGFRVGIKPQANAIMVYHSHDYPAWPGHVAWVRSVSANGSFVIQEEGNPIPGRVTERTVTPDQLVGADIDFIYSLASPR
jgi:surface antigen